MGIPKAQGEHYGSKTVKGGTRDPRRDHVRIPQEIVLIPESAVAEFLADHERVPEKNRACKVCSKGAQRGSFLVVRVADFPAEGAGWEAPRRVAGELGCLGGPAGWGGRPVRLRTADLHRVNLDVQQLKPFACLAFPYLDHLTRPLKRPGFGDELVTSSWNGLRSLDKA